MKPLLPKLLLPLLVASHTLYAHDGLPVLQRTMLPNERMWQLETELTGQHLQNGAVLECLAATLRDLLQQAGRDATVENLVQVLTTPSEPGTPESAIKELLLPQTDCIHVSLDGSFALLVTDSRFGETLDIFRDSIRGLSVQRLQRRYPSR